MFLNKIKFNYNVKVLDDLFKAKNYDSAIEIILKIKSNKDLYKALLNYLNDNYLLNFSHSQFYKKKIFWLIGYDQDDIKFLNNFFKFYFEKLKKNNVLMTDYKNFINIGLESLFSNPNDKKISFEQIVQYSNLFQTSSLLNTDQQSIIVSSSSAFFEAKNNRYFIYPNTTKSYVYIIRNPFQLYLRHKSKTNSSQDALNSLNQADYESLQPNSKNYINIVENRQNWNTNVHSWIDENVKNSFRGKIIKFEDLRASTYDTLVEILFHFKQSGLDVDLDYDLINNYVSSNIVESDLPDNLSKQEIKMITNSLDKAILSEFEYQI